MAEQVDTEYYAIKQPQPPQLAAAPKSNIDPMRRALALKNTERGRGKVVRHGSEIVRRFLESRRECDLDEKGQTRFIRMIANMVRIASSKSPLSVSAFNALMDRAYGKAKPSVEEAEAISKAGIQIVYLQPTLTDTEIAGEKKLLPPEPDFIDAEFREGE